MSFFSDRLKSLRRDTHTTQEKLAEDLGVAKSLISMYETGKRLPSFEMLESIADYFNVPISSLVGQENYSIPDILPVYPRYVPILGGAACGEPIYDPGDGTKFLPVDPDSPCDFALIARGDSMTGDMIFDGDIVYFVRCNDVQDGQIAAITIDDGVTIKHVSRLREPDGSIIRTQLLSSNLKYQPITIGGPDETRVVRIIGRAIGFYKQIS